MPTGSVRSSSYRNPCPSGTGLGYATFNDTIFLICDAAFSNDQFKDELALGLGLGLGLGTEAEGWLEEAVRFWIEQSGKL